MATEAIFTVNQDPNLVEAHYTAIGVHPEYLQHYKRWSYLRRAFAGGYEYKMGQYLTKYIYESDSEYLRRISTTPYDNHVKGILEIYNSFLFRQPVKRDFANLANMPELKAMLKDADLEGRNFDSFMRDVNIMSSLYGATVVLVDKPVSNARTRAEELGQGIRPYLNLFTPENILDWEYTRQESGIYELTYLKLLEVEQKAYGMNQRYYIREFTPELITVTEYKPEKPSKRFAVSEMPNTLGKIPAVVVYANRSPVRLIGVSDVGDIADQSNAIYNELSELEQLIRLSNHPSLVKTPEVDASAGAGAIITMPNETDGALKPYLLQPSGQSIESIIQSIEHKIDAIDRMAHMSGIRRVQTRQQSGISMITEYAQLDAKLSEKSQNLELAEEGIFDLFAMWMGTNFEGEINYPRAFHIRDRNMDMDILEKASRTVRDSVNADPEIKTLINQKVIETLVKDPFELEQYKLKVEEMQHPTTTPETKTQHIQEMIMEGYSDAQMLELHPELTQADITAAKRELLGLNDAGTQG